MKDEAYEAGYRDGGTDVAFDWWNTLNEEFGWSVFSIKETIEMIKSIMPPSPPPAFKAGDRVLCSGGMGDFDTGTVVSHAHGMYLVDVDKNPGDSRSSTYRQFWNALYVTALHEAE